MKAEEHTKLMLELAEIVKGGEGQARASEVIAELTKDYGTEKTSYDLVFTEKESLTKANQDLMVSNNKLLLELPQFNNAQDVIDNLEGGDDFDAKNDFSSLFNDKGELI